MNGRQQATNGAGNVDSGEAIVRVVRRHGLIIVAGALLGLAVGYWLARSEAPTYTAEARIVLDLQGPESATEARSLADQAEAVASSASVAAAAAEEAGYAPSMADAFEVDATALGSSGVIRLSVTGPSRERVGRFADSLANELVVRWGRYSRSGLLEAIRIADERGDQLRQELASAEEQLLDSVASGVETEIQAQTLRRNDLRDELADIRRDWAELTASLATRPVVEVIDAPEVPDEPNPSRATLDALLATMAGAALGVCAAALRELWNPAVVGALAVARAMDLPLLATISRPRRGQTPTTGEVADVADALTSVRVGRAQEPVTFLDAGSGLDLAWIEHAINLSMIAGANGDAADSGGITPVGVYGIAAAPRHAASGLAPRSGHGADPASAGHRGAPTPPRWSAEPGSAVVVAPAVASRSALEDARRLANASGRRLLGVVVVTGRRARPWLPGALDELDELGLDLYGKGHG